MIADFGSEIAILWFLPIHENGR